MARLGSGSSVPGARIVVIDDDDGMVRAVTSLLELEGHEVVGETDPLRGIELVRETKPHLLLLDFYMPVLTGDEVVRRIRAFDSKVQILLVTGYSGSRVARDLVRELKIQGYHDKSDGPDRLLLLVNSAVRAARVADRLSDYRRRLRTVSNAAGRLAQAPSTDALFAAAVEVALDLVDAGQPTRQGTAAGGRCCFVALGATPQDARVRTASGGCEGLQPGAALPRGCAQAFEAATSGDSRSCLVASWVAIPLRTAEGPAGCIHLEASTLDEEAAELCDLLGGLVGAALRAEPNGDPASADLAPVREAR
jgi:CheY-like chemotaxis protein